MNFRHLNQLLGNIDLYLLDCVLKGYFDQRDSILDAGCGEGRNCHYFISQAKNIYGIDKDPASIQMLKYTSRSLDPEYDLDRFQVAELSKIPFQNEVFDAILSSAVLHFAENKQHFLQMFSELIRVANPGALLFVRMASVFGQEKTAKHLGDGKYELQDGSIRFLLTQELLEEITVIFPIAFLEPFKTVLVHGQRSMSNLILTKN